MEGYPHDPDAALMLRVKQGDREAFEALVEKYKQPVMNLVYRTLPDAIEAEDLAQHVFLQVFKSAHRYEVSAKFSTWHLPSREIFASMKSGVGPGTPPNRLDAASTEMKISRRASSRMSKYFRRPMRFAGRAGAKDR